MSPRTRLGLKALAWALFGFLIAILPPLLLSWTNWFWLLIPVLIGCLVKSRRLATEADRTYGWPISESTKEALDRQFPGWRP